MTFIFFFLFKKKKYSKIIKKNSTMDSNIPLHLDLSAVIILLFLGGGRVFCQKSWSI